MRITGYSLERISTYHNISPYGDIAPEIHIPFSWKYMFIPFWNNEESCGKPGEILGKTM